MYVYDLPGTLLAPKNSVFRLYLGYRIRYFYRQTVNQRHLIVEACV